MTIPTFAKTHNLIAYLAKPNESEGFEQILDFLNGSSVRYALTASPTIHTSCIKQFWSTAKVKTVNDEVRVQALIDEKRVTIKESSIRRTLKLDDEEAVEEVGQAQDDVSILAEPSTYKPHKKNKSKKHQPIAPKVPSPKPSPEHQPSLPSNDLIPDADKDRLKLQELIDLCTRLSNKVMDLESEVIDLKSSFTDKIAKLEDRVHKLEEENRILKEKSFKSAKVNTAAPVKDKEESFKQGRKIGDMYEAGENIDEEEPSEVEEVLEVVTTAKLMTEVVTTAEPTTNTTAQVPKVSAPRRKRGVIIQDPEETATSVIVYTEQGKKSKRQNNKVIRYQALKRKPLTEAQARENMMIYMAGFKMNFFKGMTYSEIRPLFEKHYNSIQAFLEKGEEEVIVLEKEIEKEATPLASKVPVVDYQIHHENNKPYYKIIRADGTHKLFLSFITLKNFNREDLETIWKLVKERFETTEPKNFLDDFLLNILKIMFEKPNVEANMFLLVEKKYPLTHFTLVQMLNNVRLEVEEESKMSLEFLSIN
nr:hypothetical protein [Tanacetum cinerariifolium]